MARSLFRLNSYTVLFAVFNIPVKHFSPQHSLFFLPNATYYCTTENSHKYNLIRTKRVFEQRTSTVEQQHQKNNERHPFLRFCRCYRYCDDRQE